VLPRSKIDSVSSQILCQAKIDGTHGSHARRSSPTLPEQSIITRNEHVGCGFRKGDVRGIGNAKSWGVQRLHPFPHGTKIRRGASAIAVQEGSDFCPLTCLFNGGDFPEVYRRDDHSIPAILYVLQDQIKSVGLKTDAHEILVIVGST
jgi:hypothetical protein